MTEAQQRNISQEIDLAQFSGGTDGYHKYNMGLVLTDGAKAFAERYGAFWFLDIIASYQTGAMRAQEFQVWVLEAAESKGVVTATDGNKNVLKTQKIEFTDFPCAKGTLWLVDGVIMLQSEY